jgi:hypothetical protein
MTASDGEAAMLLAFDGRDLLVPSDERLRPDRVAGSPGLRVPTTR